VVLDSDPLQDVKALTRPEEISMVVSNGRIVFRAAGDGGSRR
jgi:hypothetical protein